VAIVLMVKTNTAPDAAPQLLPDAFEAHEVIVADSIDEAVAESSRRAPDLILLQGAPDRGSFVEAAGEVETRGQWIYWFGSKHASRDRASSARQFLELAREYFRPSDGTMH
jgi:hypothetical protein